MSWVTLSSAHILARLTTDEMDAFEAVGETGSTDKLAGIAEQVTALVRASVASCSKNTLGPAGTIPADCLYHAVSLCRSSLVASQPTQEGVTDPRKEETLAAHRFLAAVAKCEVTIEQPDGGYPAAAAESVDSYGGKCLLDF